MIRETYLYADRQTFVHTMSSLLGHSVGFEPNVEIPPEMIVE